ncbi:hypothetical protein BpHYR1_048426 [Brachionus plicatilis]|uniref:Translin-associated factor X-interacting protein 1 N-terminal domain-containing protein n=1 Tax=Brachionus plicatilis TaxID=10195 RepID=A0A3M7SSB5_BRAPC|nr:hypothetical protein BpHYR1_048426 [Brachionus plicatilis]
MTSESKNLLNKISNRILNEQSFDIKTYTSGHLNENHLWKPPEQKTHKTWKSSLPNIKSEPDQEDFIEANSSLKILKTLKRYEDLKLPSIDTNKQLPVSDKEIALKILKNYASKGATKEEKFKNIQQYERNVLQTEDLKISNVLHSNDLANYLEKKLIQELEELDDKDCSESKLIVMRLNVFSQIFHELTTESDIFGDLFSKIKSEYDDYLFYLMKNPAEIDPRVAENFYQMSNLFEQTREERLANKEQIQQLDAELESIQDGIKKYSDYNDQLEKRIKLEEDFYNEKIQDHIEARPLDTNKSKQIIKKPSKCEKIEYTKESILKKLDDLKNLSQKLKSDFVPSVVITNLNQTIKDIEIETQKINEQNKFLRKQEQEAENDLKEFLIQQDKTEFADENVE